MSIHRTKAELDAGLPHIMAAPKDAGTVEMIIVRPDHGKRETPATVAITADGGLQGDHWAKGCWKSTADGAPHPDVQVCMMSARAIERIAGPRENWLGAGDNLFLDLDLSEQNLPVGSRIRMGTVEMEITPEPHNGCAQFIEHYGREACVFANFGGDGKQRLRGVYGRVVQDGTVSRGDTVSVLSRSSP